MKRFGFYVLVMLLTFAFGSGVDRLTHYLSGNEVVPVAQLPAAEVSHVLLPATPVAPIDGFPAEPSASPGETFILDYDRKKIVRYGIFYIYGRTPGEFADLDSIELDLVGAEPPYDGYISINTRSAPDRVDVARVTFAYATERRLFFVAPPTEESKVGYMFVGEFLTRDLYSMQGKNRPALRGTLTKLKNGRKIAERVVSFVVEHMGC